MLDLKLSPDLLGVAKDSVSVQVLDGSALFVNDSLRSVPASVAAMGSDRVIVETM